MFKQNEILLCILYSTKKSDTDLGGTPIQETGTSPPSCLILENRIYILNNISIQYLK